jgi:hypothetical protein
MAEESVMVLEKSRPTLQALSQLAPQLNKATDLYTAELEEIEESLDKLNLGVAVELDDYFHTENTKTEWNDDAEVIGTYRAVFTLGYGRDQHDDWRFLVREYKERMDFNETPAEQACTPLLNTSRDLRIAAAKQIPDLLKAIEGHVKEKIEVLSKISDKR